MTIEKRVKDLENHYGSIVDALARSKDEIPSDPQLFYEELGFVEHRRTREPVTKLTAYQYAIWKAVQHYKYRLVIKSQKCGITTSSLMEDIQHALTDCKGREILIIAQKQSTANEHLRDLKYMLIRSEKYRKYLMSQSDFLFKEEKTKVGAVYIKNPDDPLQPTRVIALGSNESAVWSWKNVAHIHMSDVAALDMVDDSGFFGVAFSRLANTNGSILIETPPRGQRGSVYDIYRKSKIPSAKPEDDYERFKVFEVSAREAVSEGLMTQEFLDRERRERGILYSQLYECEFLNVGNTWYPEALLDKIGDYEIGL